MLSDISTMNEKQFVDFCLIDVPVCSTRSSSGFYIPILVMKCLSASYNKVF